jgi:N-acylneuraminate cytidylyltransferase
VQSFRAVTIIPARGGSQGLKRKNVLSFAGKPLIAHTILQSKECRLIDHTFVSTDDDEIETIARGHDVGVITRPADISAASSSSESALCHALSKITSWLEQEPDYIVFLQCTSPLRTSEDIEKALLQIHTQKYDSLLSVCASHRFIWRDDRSQAVPVNYDYRFRPLRQDMADQYVENGAIYIFKPEILRRFRNRLGGKIGIYVMQGWQAFEVDSLDDFLLCEWLYQRYLMPPQVERQEHVIEVISDTPGE